MRILLISPMPPAIGGISITNSRLADRLKDDGYDVTVFAQNFNNIRFNYVWLRVLKELSLPFFLLTHRKFDIIHAHVSGIPRRVFISFLKLFCMKGAKLIYTMHGDISRQLKSKAWIWSLNKADKIICVQKGDSAKMPKDILISKSIDIPAYILPKKINSEGIPEHILDFVKLNHKPLMIFNGLVVINDTFNDLYGFMDAIELYNILKSEGIEVKMLMINNTDLMNSTQKKFCKHIKELTAGDSNFKYVEGEKFPLLPLFKNARIYFRPTKTDGDSLSVRESMSMGCQCIASDVAIRPDGCIVYHDINDLVSKTKEALFSDKKYISKGFDFYNKIINIYNTL